MLMQTKTLITLDAEEGRVLAKARDILEEIAEKLNKTDGEADFEDDDDANCVEEIARYGKDISDIIY